MSSKVDREAFMRHMGLTAADIADPDSVAKRASPHTDAPRSSALTAGMAGRSTAYCKALSPAESSDAGLSHSTSLRGDLDPLFNSYATTKTCLRGGAGGAKLGAAVAPSAERSGAPAKPSARTVSFEAPPHRATAAASMPSRPVCTSETLKEEGNRAFESGLFVEAIRHYSAAIEALGQGGVDGGGSGGAVAADMRGPFGAVPGSTSPSVELELLAALYSNRSAAYLQAARQWSSTEEAYGRALCDADRAVALRPSWFKGYTRQGDACFKLHRYGAAAEAYEMALQLDPRNTTLADALAETRRRAKQAAREELEMRRTMRATGGSHLSSMQSSDRGTADKWIDGDGVTHRAGAASAPLAGESAYATGGSRRSSGQTSQLWDDLKHEVEATMQAPTGDAYRLQQLERFRKRASAGAAEAPHVEATRSEQRSRPRPVLAPTHEYQRAPAAAREPSPHEMAPTSTDRFRGGHPTGMSPASLAPPTSTTTTRSAAAGPSASASAPVTIPHRSTYDSPTAGGIPAAMANFSGPVMSARDVPYEFSSAAASAYQQQLLEKFRQRKARQS
ncbi:hypothetical protein ABL78_6819 [Leptomonas seymouri]|uniref:Uncharacterized protein n=1 Tax=Leptomonas seymouri TaxID=5684 RepID=A0A0N1I0B2_LEPSE|nr:hypothetical protein ABL78_6819 [Leptomonas seymouri]|eukprot:KPI84121.1 hypothetical protein ABL78_6819 [Leptomonas seymouri]